jgi:hypothetical protein
LERFSEVRSAIQIAKGAKAMLYHHTDRKWSKMGKNNLDINPQFSAKSELTFEGVIQGPSC